MDEDTFKHLYFTATEAPHSFLTIDTNSPPAKQFRRNFDTFLNPKSLHYNQSGEEDENEEDAESDK